MGKHGRETLAVLLSDQSEKERSVFGPLLEKTAKRQLKQVCQTLQFLFLSSAVFTAGHSQLCMSSLFNV